MMVRVELLGHRYGARAVYLSYLHLRLYLYLYMCLYLYMYLYLYLYMWEERGGDAPGMGRSTDLGHWGDTSDGRAGHCCIPLTIYWVHWEASALPYIKVSWTRALQHNAVHYRAILYWADPCTASGSAGALCGQFITMHGSVASCCCPSQACIGE